MLLINKKKPSLLLTTAEAVTLYDKKKRVFSASATTRFLCSQHFSLIKSFSSTFSKRLSQLKQLIHKWYNIEFNSNFNSNEIKKKWKFNLSRP